MPVPVPTMDDTATIDPPPVALISRNQLTTQALPILPFNNNNLAMNESQSHSVVHATNFVGANGSSDASKSKKKVRYFGDTNESFVSGSLVVPIPIPADDWLREVVN